MPFESRSKPKSASKLKSSPRPKSKSNCKPSHPVLGQSHGQVQVFGPNLRSSQSQGPPVQVQESIQPNCLVPAQTKALTTLSIASGQHKTVATVKARITRKAHGQVPVRESVQLQMRVASKVHVASGLENPCRKEDFDSCAKSNLHDEPLDFQNIRCKGQATSKCFAWLGYLWFPISVTCECPADVGSIPLSLHHTSSGHHPSCYQRRILISPTFAAALLSRRSCARMPLGPSGSLEQDKAVQQHPQQHQ